MCVFALASRYSKDERVLLPDPPDEPLDDEYMRLRWQKAGFKYYFAAMGKYTFRPSDCRG